MTAQKQEEINLLPEKGFESSTTGRVLAWILSSFRVIVIVTEVIVMVAFLSRFWLDAQNSDLSDEIEQKQALLTASLSFEKEFKNTQKRLKIYSDLSKQEDTISTSLITITNYLPQDLFLKQTNYSNNIYQVKGTSPNETGIQQFIVNLLSSGKFSEVALDEIVTNSKDPNVLEFSLTAFLANQKQGEN